MLLCMKNRNENGSGRGGLNSILVKKMVERMTTISYFVFNFYFILEYQEDPLEEEMATHSSILAEKIPWTEEPDGL